MGVAAWGYGTGSTGGTAWPFGLRIQGVDYIRSVPLDSITVNSSLSSNATLTFRILDLDNALPIPPGFADVEFVDYGGTTATAGAFDADSFDADSFDTAAASPTQEAKLIFSGLVLSASVKAAVLGREITVACVDYGYLLDRTLVAIDMDAVYWPSWIWRPAYPPGITVLEGAAYTFWTSVVGRVGNWPRYTSYNVWGSSGQYTGSIRGFLESASIEGHDSLPVFIYIDPQRRLNFWSTWALTVSQKAASLDVVLDQPLAGETTVADMEVIYDHTTAESAAWLSDPITPENDGVMLYGTDQTNGYAIGADSVNYRADYVGLTIGSPYNVKFDSPRTAAEWYYLRQERGGGGPSVRGSFTYTGDQNWEIASVFAVTAAGLGLDAAEAFVYSVTTRFLGGAQRECRVSWSLVPVETGATNKVADKASYSRWLRTRFARAGVTT